MTNTPRKYRPTWAEYDELRQQLREANNGLQVNRQITLDTIAQNVELMDQLAACQQREADNERHLDRLWKAKEQVEAAISEMRGVRACQCETLVATESRLIEVEAALAESNGALGYVSTALDKSGFNSQQWKVVINIVDAALSLEAGKQHMEMDRVRDEALKFYADSCYEEYCADEGQQARKALKGE